MTTTTSQPSQFGGALPDVRARHDSSAAVILPVPFDRTTSYVPGTRNGPRELLLASAQVELWDEEIGVDVHGRGMFTLPELDLTAAHDGRRPWPSSAASPAASSTTASS